MSEMTWTRLGPPALLRNLVHEIAHQRSPFRRHGEAMFTLWRECSVS